MRNLLAALLFSTMTVACSKTPDATTATPVTTDPGSAAGTMAAAPPSAPSAPAPVAAAQPAAAAPAPAAEPAPDLVEAAPGVQVVADYDTPVFFNSGRYWRFNEGGWYSSSVYTGGWELDASPPSVIVHIDRPERFVHFKPSGYVAHNHPAPQREWHPAPVHAEVHAEVHTDVHAEPHTEVRVEPHGEVRPPVVVKTVAKPVVHEHRD